MTTRSYAVRLEAEYQALVQGFNEGAKAADKLADKVEHAGQRVERAQKAQADAAGRLRTAEQQLAQARQKGAADSAQVVAAEERSAKARRDLDQATKDVAAAEAAHRSAQAANEQATARQTTAVGKLTGAVDTNREAIDRAGTTLAAFGAITTATVGATVAAAVQWESAWTGVTKTLPNGADLKATEDGLRSLAKTLPSTHEEIAAVAEAAGQLGVAADSIVPFTKVMIDLGETTNLTADEAATSIAQLMNVMRTAPDEVDNLGASLVALGNNGASTERDIIQMAQRIAGAGEIVGMSEGDVMGLANALASVGIEVEAGGSAISAVMTDIATVVSTNSSNLTTWAAVAGMSASDFAAAWRDDPADALAAFVEGLGKMQAAGQDVFTTLSDLGQKDIRVSRALLSMATSGDLLRKSIELGNQAWEDNTALLAEANKRYDTASAKMEIARNSIQDSAITVGQEFLPALARGAEAVAGLANAFSDLPDWAQQAVGGLGGIVGAAALVAGGLLVVAPRAVDTVKAFKQLRDISPGVASGLGKVGKAATVAGAALVALEVLDTIGSTSEKAAAGMEQTTAAVLEGADGYDRLFAAIDAGRRESKTWDWGQLFSSRGDQATEINTLADAIDRLVNPSMKQKIGDWAESVPVLSSIVSVNDGKNAAAQFTAVGEALAFMVEQGHADEAAAQFKYLSDRWTAAGGSLDDLNARMPAYATALAGVDNEQTLAAKSAQGVADGVGQVGQMSDEAIEALEKWREMVSGASTSFRDLGGAWQAAIDQQRTFAEEAAEKTKTTKDSWEDFYDGVSVSADQWIEQLQKQAEAQARWRDNVLTASQQVRDELPANMAAAADAMIDDLIARGPEGAAMLESFVTAGPERRAKIVETWQQMGQDITGALENIRSPQITVEANTDLATEQTTALLGVIDSATGTVTVYGNGAPVLAELGDVTTKVDEASGTVTIFGEDGQALTTLSGYVATVDGADGTVQIRGNDENGRSVVVGLKNWVTQQSATITVDASTTKAQSALDRVIASNSGRTITVGTRVIGPGAATGMRLPAFAGGGRFPGVAPANPASDNLLGVDETGMPRVRVRSREWVVNEPAADYYGDAIMGAMNSRAVPRDLFSALPGLAAGGGIYTTFGMPSLDGKDAAYWRDAFMDFPDRYRLLDQINTMQADLGGLSGLARSASEQEIAEAKTKLSEAEYAATIAGGNPGYWDGVVAAQDVQKSARRGDYTDQATSGLSGAYGLVDTLYSESRNAGLSTSGKQALTGAASAAEAQFASLYGQLDQVNAAIEKQRDLIGDLQQAYDQAKSAISGAFDLQGVARQQDQLVAAAQTARERADSLKNDYVYDAHTNDQGETYYTSRLSDQAVQAETDAQAAETAAAGAGTGTSYLLAAQQYAANVRSLAGKIDTLVRRGVPQRVISEILGMGIDGGALDAADAIASLSDQQLGQLTTAYSDIDRYSGQIGQSVTATMYTGGLAAANTGLLSLTGQQASLEGQITAVGQQISDLLADVFGVPRRADGGAVWPGQTFLTGERGVELAVLGASGPQYARFTKPGYVLDAATTRNLAKATAVGLGVGGTGGSVTQVTKTYQANVNTLQATPAQVLAAVRQAELQDVMP
ncbi:phage tail tape measure protein [Xylanimonas protaetiae]|uniref:Phage tail tape measure protein n=1 Tax=Xylanimonas protaetiae TaxID=2509457 RepID=A0A4P6F2C5_9MICO|nr:phage tail tape measure protein [Xylanimonas protaetiae]QAY69980.1 phage tail tape measure protein [Xylanimonas protaetiae]